MRKYGILLFAALAVCAIGYLALNAYIYSAKQGGVDDFREISTVIDGEVIAFGENGTHFFGNEAEGDVNDDGIPDIAFLFTRETGGSGTFYYAVAALQNSEGRYSGTNAVFLGDRIAPQSSEIRNSIFVVNYADRAKNEPFSVAPSVGMTAYLYYQDGELRIERPIQLFYYDPTLDVDEKGNVLCSEKGLVRVPRLMPGISADDAVRALLEGALTVSERERGITTEFPLEGLSLIGSSLVKGVLTLTFDDPLRKTSGGACRAAVLWQQIKATAQQFSGIEDVRFEPAELFQP